MSKPKQPQPQPQPQSKKAYRKPVLVTYGAVRDFTRSVTGTGMNDSMSGSTTKTG